MLLRHYNTQRRMLPHLIFCLSFCLLLLKPQLCSAQQQPMTAASLDEQVIKIDVKSASLDTMITLLGQKLHAGVVVDDRPHHVFSDFLMETTPRKALDRIADAFDYSWKLSRSGMVMFYKRFKDPTEFPQMDLAEWQQMAKDAIAVIGADTHDFSPGAHEATMRSFVGGLSRVNVHTLLAGKPVDVSDLEEGQLVPLREYMYQRAFERIVGGWISLRKALSQLPGSALQMRMQGDPLDLLASQQEHRKQQQVLTLSRIYTGDDGKERIFTVSVPQTEIGDGIGVSVR